MSDVVNKYHRAIHENTEKAEPSEEEASLSYSPTNCPPSERLRKSAHAEPESDFPSDQPIEPGSLTDEEAHSIEQELERELAISLSDAQPDIQEIPNAPNFINETDERFEQACMDMVKQVQEEIYQDPGEGIEINQEKMEATHDAFGSYHETQEYQSSPFGGGDTAPLEYPPQAALPQDSPGRFGAKLAVIAVALAGTGFFLELHKHPVVSQGIARVSGIIKPATKAPVTSEISLAAAIPDASPGSANEGTTEIALASNAAVSSNVSTVTSVVNWPTGLLERMATDPNFEAPKMEPEVELDVLNVNLKMTEAHMDKLKREIASGEQADTANLQAELIQVHAEIDDLNQKIATFGSSSSDPKVVKTSAYLADGKPAEDPYVASSRNSLDISAAGSSTQPITLQKSKTPRDVNLVEVAMASTPGLNFLTNSERQILREKLISGDCLIPALTAVFPQVPVLVMRDMVQKFDSSAQSCAEK